jgi:hypothetical protein
MASPQPCTGERHAHELPGAPSDDRDHRRADAVERALHPPETAEAHVQRRQRQHHEERRQDERERDQRRAGHAGAHPAEVDGELRGERSGCELREGQAFFVVARRDPAAILDEVALHVAAQRDRAAEAERPEAQEVAE